MSRLEIIHLRSAGEPLESVGERIRDSIQEKEPSSDVVTLYRRRGLETDVAVHIQHLGPSAKRGPSNLGLHLASALSTFGLVEHNLWEELR